MALTALFALKAQVSRCSLKARNWEGKKNQQLMSTSCVPGPVLYVCYFI